jgi:hypothetical protein
MTPEDELRQLLEQVTERVLAHVDKYGWSIPCCRAHSPSGEVIWLLSDSSAPDKPYDPKAHLQAVTSLVRRWVAQKKVRAIALAKTVNVTVSSEQGPRETAAVKVLLDHQAGRGYAAYVTYHDQGGKTVADNVIYDELKERFFPPPEKAYLMHAFLPSAEPPSAEEAKAYLLEGALFEQAPVISIRRSADGVFDEMALNFDPERQPMILRRLSGEDAEAARVRAAGEASGPGGKQIKREIENAQLVLEWEVERSQLDEDAWFALHLWQAWILRPSKGWLYAPGDGIFDSELKRQPDHAE